MNQARGVLVGFLPAPSVLPIWGLQVGLSVLFVGSYWRARKVELAPSS